MKNSAASLLIAKGNDLLKIPYTPLAFTKDPEIDRYLNDLDFHPHFFVLACLMDLQMKAEKAWKIPYYVSIEIGSPRFVAFTGLSLDETLKIFTTRKLHRFTNKMTIVFYKGVMKLFHDYNGYATRIWRDDLSALTIMNRFLEFEGVGPKIASMATNILIREFKLPIQDKSYIDISPDVHVKRVFTRLGLIDMGATNIELINSARELYPDYPGVFDLPTWEVGRNWCRATNPDCNNCFLNEHCIKIGLQKNSKLNQDTGDNKITNNSESLNAKKRHSEPMNKGMLTALQAEEIEQAARDFRSRIMDEMEYIGTKNFSFPGGATEKGDNYTLETSYGTLAITVIPDTGRYNRLLHFVNLNQLEGIVASDIEINIPKVIDRRSATLTAIKKDHRFLCNRGRCTVFMSALPKVFVLDHFSKTYGNVEELLDNGRINHVIRYADLDSEDLFEQIACFTHQMKEFKKLFKSKI